MLIILGIMWQFDSCKFLEFSYCIGQLIKIAYHKQLINLVFEMI